MGTYRLSLFFCPFENDYKSNVSSKTNTPHPSPSVTFMFIIYSPSLFTILPFISFHSRVFLTYLPHYKTFPTRSFRSDYSLYLQTYCTLILNAPIGSVFIRSVDLFVRVSGSPSLHKPFLSTEEPCHLLPLSPSSTLVSLSLQVQ